MQTKQLFKNTKFMKMRKIVKEAVEMFMTDTPSSSGGWVWKKSNTEVTKYVCTDADVIFMRLHGNNIAIRKRYRDPKKKDEISICLAGWPTPTTISRLNGICGGNHLRRRRGDVYYNGVKIDIHDWVDINKRKPMFHEYENN